MHRVPDPAPRYIIIGIADESRTDVLYSVLDTFTDSTPVHPMTGGQWVGTVKGAEILIKLFEQDGHHALRWMPHRSRAREINITPPKAITPPSKAYKPAHGGYPGMFAEALPPTERERFYSEAELNGDDANARY